MRFFESLLVLVSLTVLVVQLRRSDARPPWSIWLALSATPLLLAHLVVDGYRVLLIPSYAVAVVFLFRAIMQLLGEARPAPSGRLVRTAAGLASVLTILLIVTGSTVSVVLTPLTDDQDEIVAFLLPPHPADLRRLDWTGAFDSLARRFRAEYPFGGWKDIPWDTMYQRTFARVAAAQALGDRDAYLLALRGWVWSIPDAQLALEADWATLRDRAIGGSYGFEMAHLDSGQVVAARVSPDGPAAQAGLREGATLLSWNRLPIDSAVALVDPLWTEIPPATTAARRAAQRSLLTRAPVGTGAELSFRNPGDAITAAVSLVAIPAGEPVAGARGADADSLPIEARVLDDGLGYVRIRRLFPARGQFLPARAFRQAITELREARATGLILDIRGNTGGAHKLVTSFMGHLVEEPAYYSQAASYKAHLDSFVVEPHSTLRITPHRPRYSGPVVALVDGECAQACEGIARAVRRLPFGIVSGLEGTAAAFGLSGGAIRLPGGVTIRYPVARLLDSLGVVSLESDATGRGGVAPSRPVPLVDSTLRVLTAGQDLALDYARFLLRSRFGGDSLTGRRPSSSNSGDR